jgi:Prophage antirepressor
MKELQLLDERQLLGKTFRIFGDPQNPLFMAKDVAEWIEHSDVSTMLRTVDEDEKLTQTLFVSGQNREMWLLTEEGLYEVLMQSRKPIAKEFKRQVKDILKSIRRHGGYLTPAKIEEVLSNPDTIIMLAQNLKRERERTNTLTLLNAQKEQIICEMQPKATYYDLILQNKSVVPITLIAKDYGMSGAALNAKLHELGIQYKQGNIWLLYQKYADKGYTHSKTHVIDAETTKFHTYWTQSGRLFVYDLLKRQDILPLIEREGLRLVSGK